MCRAALALIFSLLTLPVEAMQISPMGVEMLAMGQNARGQVVIANNSAVPLPVEMVYERLTYDESGKRLTSKANDELLILPPTAMIPPGSSQTFRLQWVGNPDLAESASFMVYAKQLPVRPAGEARKTQIQIVSAFGVIVNVAPAQGKAALKLVSWKPVKDVKGQPAVAVVVENPTNVHALMSKSQLRIGGLSLGPDAMLQRVGFGVVGPRKRRSFVISLDGVSGAPSGNGSINYLGDNR